MFEPYRKLEPEKGGVENTDVLLVSMPFGSLFQPSIGLSLLKSSLTSLNIPVKVLYFTFPFAEMIGAPLYKRISNGDHDVTDIVGEWIFSIAVFDEEQLDVKGYVDNVLRNSSNIRHENEALSDAAVQEILDARQKVDEFLDACIDEIISYQPKVVGLTSLFQQQTASLALAKRLKAKFPKITTLLGGPNCEGIMGAEVVRQFPFIDIVVSGEGDVVFPQLIELLLDGRRVSNIPGVYTRQNVGALRTLGSYSNAASVHNMDTLPFPDYSDFFEQLDKSHLEQSDEPWLLFETSRGCWWGEKSICTFCGLNGETMAYRSKSAERALEELLFLTRQYPDCPVAVVDNILDMNYFKNFLPDLAAKKLDLELFYDIKANLKKNQVQLLSDAGIKWIQPGIESLSNQVLEIMRKGVKVRQNVQLLKWCKEVGIRPFWNLIWGFPGESPEEYARMAELVPLISHLTPPDAAGTMRLDRFSPNFENAEKFGLVNVKPYPAYYFTYPFAPDVVANLAYYFTFDYHAPQDVSNYTRFVAREIKTWQTNHENSHLISVDLDPLLLLCDMRPIAKESVIVLDEMQSLIYKACDSARTPKQLQRLLKEQCSGELLEQEIDKLLESFTERGLMLKDEDAYLSLAIPVGDYMPEGIPLPPLIT